jgi:hypothetical protein
MSWEASGFVKKMLQCPDGAKLTRGQKCLLLVLADYHDTKRRVAWPGVSALAEESLASLSQTKRDLEYLQEHLVLVRCGKAIGSGNTYSYKFVGLDLALDQARELLSKRVQGEPFFYPAQKGSERVQKGFAHAEQKGSERVRPCFGNKEEPEPSTEPENQEGAARAAMPYSARAERFGHSCPIPTAKFLREVGERRQALTGMNDYDAVFKRFVLAVAEECRIPPPIALAMWGYDESECAEADQARAS